MKSLSMKLSLLVMVASIAGANAANNPDETTLSQITDYRHWTRMNPEPVKISTPVSLTPPTFVLSEAKAPREDTI